MKNVNKLFWLSLVLLLVSANRLFAAPVVRAGAGANAAAIQATVDQFRSDIGGANNGVGSSFTNGRREINWDAVPDQFAEPNNFPPNFFNSNSPRGAVFNTIEQGSALNQFAVSAKNGNPSGAAVRFGNINAAYSNIFQVFSPERLFIARNTTVLEATFFIPGTKIPATVSGFGIVFTDVDTAENARITLYAPDGTLLSTQTAPTWDNGLSFVGVSFNAGERIARVVIQSGKNALSAANTDGQNAVDVVAMDDFIYGEPRALQYHPSDFDGDGTSDFNVFRPSSGAWFVLNSGSNTVTAIGFGQNGDIPIEGDFDGDQRSDIAVFRPSNGTWYRFNSSDNAFVVVQFGLSGDKPVPGDYDKDQKTDIAVWRPSLGDYFVLRSSDGQFQSTHWGTNGDVPVNSNSNQ